MQILLPADKTAPEGGYVVFHKETRAFVSHVANRNDARTACREGEGLGNAKTADCTFVPAPVSTEMESEDQNEDSGVNPFPNVAATLLNRDPAPAPKQLPIDDKLHKSAVIRPTKQVWFIADEMLGAKRSEVIAECEKRGIATFTARTQYQLWYAVQKEMKAREAANAS